MKLIEYTAVVYDNNASEIGRTTTYAWNSAIKATESIMRQYARDHMTPATGAKPVVMDADAPVRIYRRVWVTTTGKEFKAMVYASTQVQA